MPTAVELSMCMGVGGCGWPNSCRVRRMILASFAFRKSAPSSASAADAATNLSKLQRTWIAPLSAMGLPSSGIDPKKKYPAARLLALGALKYEASEWTFNIMSDL